MTSSPLACSLGDILIFGCGTMAGAMVQRWIECGLPPEGMTAIRPSARPVAGGIRSLASSDGLAAPRILLIGLKPQTFAHVASDLARLAGSETLVISIMAGIALEDLAATLPDAGSIVRVMPNLPVAEGHGVVLRVGTPHDDALEATLAALLAPLGHVHNMADETGFNLITALTGCGPAFVYRFVAALAGAAVRLGLDEKDADILARATVAGAAASIAASDRTPTEMADAVASPGGMTQAGLDVLDSDGRLAALLAETLRASRDRGRELAQALRSD